MFTGSQPSGGPALASNGSTGIDAKSRWVTVMTTGSAADVLFASLTGRQSNATCSSVSASVSTRMIATRTISSEAGGGPACGIPIVSLLISSLAPVSPEFASVKHVLPPEQSALQLYPSPDSTVWVMSWTVVVDP